MKNMTTPLTKKHPRRYPLWTRITFASSEIAWCRWKRNSTAWHVSTSRRWTGWQRPAVQVGRAEAINLDFVARA